MPISKRTVEITTFTCDQCGTICDQTNLDNDWLAVKRPAHPGDSAGLTFCTPNCIERYYVSQLNTRKLGREGIKAGEQLSYATTIAWDPPKVDIVYSSVDPEEGQERYMEHLHEREGPMTNPNWPSKNKLIPVMDKEADVDSGPPGHWQR